MPQHRQQVLKLHQRQSQELETQRNLTSAATAATFFKCLCYFCCWSWSWSDPEFITLPILEYNKRIVLRRVNHTIWLNLMKLKCTLGSLKLENYLLLGPKLCFNFFTFWIFVSSQIQGKYIYVEIQGNKKKSIYHQVQNINNHSWHVFR